MQKVPIKGLSHITGGGISENLPRVYPADVHAVVDRSTWQQGAVFDWLARHGNIADDEMLRTFNCGVGMVVVVDNKDVGTALSTLQALGENARQIGRVDQGEGPVDIPLSRSLCKTAVLISGSGSNLQAFIDKAAHRARLISTSKLFSAISLTPLAWHARRLRALLPNAWNIVTIADREAFDRAVAGVLDAYQPDLIVLAGFMRILSSLVRTALRRSDPEHPPGPVTSLPRVGHSPESARRGGRMARQHGALCDRRSRRWPTHPTRQAGCGSR